MKVENSAHNRRLAYSITSSARARGVGEIVTSKAFAVLRIDHELELGWLLCCTGRSPGLALAAAAAAAYRIGAYCRPPFVQSAFCPRWILSAEPSPTFFSKISP